MMTRKFWMISADPQQLPSKTIEYIIKRSYNKFGIFLDYDCPEGQECILQVSSHATAAPKQKHPSVLATGRLHSLQSEHKDGLKPLSTLKIRKMLAARS
jgi:hypothetical protein